MMSRTKNISCLMPWLGNVLIKKEISDLNLQKNLLILLGLIEFTSEKLEYFILTSVLRV